jgi:hypothetical protein
MNGGFGRPRKGSRYQWHCPQCEARVGAPCTNAEGEKLPGVHFERNRERRRAIEAAFDLYRPLGAPVSIEKYKKYP